MKVKTGLEIKIIKKENHLIRALPLVASRKDYAVEKQL